jgi:hypothetical protein
MLGDRELREYQFDEEGSEIADPLVALAQPDSILVSRVFADKYRLADGDRLPLYTLPGAQGVRCPWHHLQPTGIGEIFDGQIAVMDVFNAQYVFNRGRNIDRIDLMNELEVDVEELATPDTGAYSSWNRRHSTNRPRAGNREGRLAMRIGHADCQLHRLAGRCLYHF